ncbi:MAG: hypothetical protein ABIG11_10400, partial [bacterium]
GIISVRIGLFFFMGLLLWYSAARLPRFIELGSACILLVVSLTLMQYHWKVSRQIDSDIRELCSVEKYLAPNRTLLPLNYSGNWFHLHFSNYLGIKKPLVIFENYEASTGYFPLKWTDKGPGNLGDAFRHPPCADIERYEKTTGAEVDYVFRWYFKPENTDSCASALEQVLKKNYTCVFLSENKKAELFKRM